jgi:hypothetical protein
MLGAVALVGLSGCRGALPVARTVVSGRDSMRVAPVSRGIVRETHWLAEGPWVAEVVRVDLQRCDCRLDGVHAFDGIRGRERVSAMAQRLTTRGVSVLAAINADFFDLKTGDVENNQVIGGEWTKGNGVSESPHHTFPTVHAQVAQRSNGEVVIGRFRMRAVVTALRGQDSGSRRDTVVVDAINPQRRLDRRVVLYSWRHGDATPTSGGVVYSGSTQVDPDGGPPTAARLAAAAQRDSARLAADTVRREVIEVALVPVGGGTTAIPSGRASYRVLGRGSGGAGGQKIPNGGIVLSVRRDDASYRMVSGWTERDEVMVEVQAVGLDGAPGAGVVTLVGGWGELIADGVDRSALVDSLEGTFPRFSAARHPRTAVGVARRGREVLLVGVDGRGSNGSAGMSLVELGRWMGRLGATSAANLDGGGSTTVWVRGAGVVNRPSDPTGERPVGNGLFVVGR